MPILPRVGTRVAVRYRRPHGAKPPLTDAVGHLLATAPMVQVRTKNGDVVEFAPADVLTVRRLTDIPVRNSQIRAVEHAAALAWPGVEQQWLDGWLLRAGHGIDYRANSAIPLDISARSDTVPAIIDWYLERGATPRLAIPDRLLSLPADAPAECETRMLVCDLSSVSLPLQYASSATLEPRPNNAWLACYAGDLSVDVLTAVVDGEVAFGLRSDAAVARAAVTKAPDGTAWVGLSALRIREESRDHAHALSAALLSWGVERGATHAYAQVAEDCRDAAATLPALESLGFIAQHRCRYLSATWLAEHRL
ncbi:N-acetylglutamate synthase, CG3035 family [Mycobacterium sp.]|uniref:N-acetylglutamate synthase, CG3035 family n=1 Tax=Mycobacterium sp. TaxID=1785 RepID=UPI003BA9CB69